MPTAVVIVHQDGFTDGLAMVALPSCSMRSYGRIVDLEASVARAVNAAVPKQTIPVLADLVGVAG